MSKVTALDVVGFARASDIELVELTLAMAQQALDARKDAKAAVSKRLEKARAARGKNPKAPKAQAQGKAAQGQGQAHAAHAQAAEAVSA
jgi:hypothetical protein